MRLTPSDPDIETLLRRIDHGDIDLQPDFQRGEVWGIQKQNRLIDTILRQWYIPPIHVIEHADRATLEVLDGQQRLASIRDYYNGTFAFDGLQPPINKELIELNGLRFHELPDKYKIRLLRFPIRQYTIHGFEPGEPAELFFRLNQQVALTAAEQRNAFFGPVRDQVHHMVSELVQAELGKDTLGFGNSRMAYDDVIARVCLTLENRSLRVKITSTALSERYRSSERFSSHIQHSVENSLLLLARIIERTNTRIRFNKPTLYSWLIFMSTLESNPNDSELFELLTQVFLVYNELIEKKSTHSFAHSFLEFTPHSALPTMEFLHLATWAYIDRSSSRVSDVFSVISRDIYLWLIYYSQTEGAKRNRKSIQIKRLHDFFYNGKRAMEPISGEDFFATLASDYSWDLS